MNIPPIPTKNGSSKNTNNKQQSSSVNKKQPIVRKNTNVIKVKKHSEEEYEPISTSQTNNNKKKTNNKNMNSNKAELSKRHSSKFMKETTKNAKENNSFNDSDEIVKPTQNKLRAYDTENLDKYNTLKETKKNEVTKNSGRVKEPIDFKNYHSKEFKNKRRVVNQFHERDTYNAHDTEKEYEEEETQEKRDGGKNVMSHKKNHTEEYENSEPEEKEINKNWDNEQRKIDTQYENSKDSEEEYYEEDREEEEEYEEEYSEEETEEEEYEEDEEEHIEEYEEEEEEEYEEEYEDELDEEENEEKHKTDTEKYKIEIKKDTSDSTKNEKKWYEKENDFLAKLQKNKQDSIKSRSISSFQNNSKDNETQKLKDKKFIKSDNCLEKQSSNKFSIFKENAKKSFNVVLDPKRSFSMKLPSPNVGYNTLGNKKNKTNEHSNDKIFKSKSQVLRAAELFLSVSNTPIPRLERKSTESSFIRKNKILEKQSIAGPFKPKEKEKKTPIRKSGHLPKYMKNSAKHVSRNLGKEHNRNKMKLIPQQKPNTFKIFQNLVILDNEGKIHTWDGYQWNHLYIPYERFISLYTNKFGNVLCINSQFDCGYLLNNKQFRCIHSWEQYNFAKIVFSNKGKLWGISLTGDLFRWNKFEWKKIKKAFGIANLKSISFDQQNQLWALDICDYFYIYDYIDKSWVVKDIKGKNIKDFDFNKNNHMIATTNEGLVKINNSEKWISYGMLGQKKILSIHFIRENNNTQKKVPELIN